MSARLTTDVFIDRAKQTHGGKFDYSRSIYTNAKNKVVVICPVHGQFEILPHCHMLGVGCAKCSGKHAVDLAEFLKRAKKVHGNTYDYSKVVLNKTIKDPVVITCLTHGEFLQSPYHHTARKQGCPKCGKIRTGLSRRLPFTEFKKKADAKFGGKFIYDEVSYTKRGAEFCFLCPVHGLKKTKVDYHLSSQHGCPDCFLENSGDNTLEKRKALFLEKANSTHGQRYTYYLDEYQDMSSSIRINCGVEGHGDFWLQPQSHIYDKCGCPRCFGHTSQGQEQLINFLKIIGLKVIPNFKLSNNTHIDAFCPELRICFEYDGLFWHSEKYRQSTYHINKTETAKSQGIRLFHIFADEWVYKREICENRIKSLCGLNELKYNARALSIKKISSKEAKSFFQTTHLQGLKTNPKFSYGLVSENTIVACMSFSTSNVRKGEIELIRFSSIGQVRGGFSKLLSAFVKEHGQHYKAVISFSDLRWSVGDVYQKNGFSYIHRTTPNHWWTKGEFREDRRNFQHKYLAKKLKTYSPHLSEVENCHANGYLRIYDCGRDKWVLEIK